MKKTILNLSLVGGIALATVACKNENNNAETTDAILRSQVGHVP